MNARSPRDLLGRLPEAAPPEHLWDRISLSVETDRSRRRHGRRRVLGTGAIALAAALVVLLAVSRPTADGAVEAAIRDARLLEARLARFDDRRPALDPLARSLVVHDEARLLAVDQALTTAYAKGTGSEEIGRLWDVRITLLSRLLASLELAAQVEADAT